LSSTEKHLTLSSPSRFICIIETMNPTLSLIRKYRALDQQLNLLYSGLASRKRIPLILRRMWKNLASDEKEHLIYWKYLEREHYALNNISSREIGSSVSRISEYTRSAEKLLQKAGKDTLSLEEAFDATVNTEFLALTSPMQNFFYTHDIILEDKIFNPLEKYDLHLKRITAQAGRIYAGEPLKLNLISSMLKIKDEKDRLLLENVRDSLTGTRSRRYFFDNAGFLLNLARRENKPFALVMMDVDGFKGINDRFGHPAGDRVLSTIGKKLSGTIRSADIVARYGGDEFVIALYDQNENQVNTFLARISRALADVKIRLNRRATLPVKMSWGYSLHLPGREDSISDMIKTADRDLYKMKAMRQNASAP